jgi:hypothetical protein
LNACLDALLDQCRPAFRQRRTFERARSLLYSNLVCFGRHTVSGLLCATGQQFSDWSATYRLFEHQRFDPDLLFAPVRRAVVECLPNDGPVVAALDDTLLRKTGKRTEGCAWRRDPLGAPFGTSFTWSQRFLQTALLLPKDGWNGTARAIPVDLAHAPTPKRPRRHAPDEEKAAYREAQRVTRLGEVARQRIHLLRESLDRDDPARTRALIVVGDGGYTNRSVYRDIPDNTVLIGRIRRDAQLHAVPKETKGAGRRRLYGDLLPTPEALRHDDSLPWTEVQVFAAGQTHTCRVKTRGLVRWKPAGGKDLRIVIVEPLAYRLRKRAKLLYRNPAYLVCTDPSLSLQELLQAYIWRWDVEVAFHEEKTLLGMGQAQVRTPSSVPLVPAFVAAAYGLLHVVAHQVGADVAGLPLPKWRTHPAPRPTTAMLVNQVRAELWGKALGVHFDGFVDKTTPVTRSPQNALPSLVHAALYATN